MKVLCAAAMLALLLTGPVFAQGAQNVIKPALEQVTGVASVEVKGGAEREVHVDLDLARIDALNLSPLAILERLKQQNLTVPAGSVIAGRW